MADENRLRGALVKGGIDAFKDAYVHYFPSVRGFLRVWLGNAEASEDLTQDTFLQLWHHPDRFDPTRSNMKTYLLGIARKKAADWWRRAGKGAPEYEAVFSAKVQQAHAVQQVLEQLAPDLRNTLWLREAEGYSYEEISEILQVPLGTVKSRLFAAREQMRQIWNAKKEKV